MRKRSAHTAGFALSEALIALAVAVTLAACLTRVIANTRMNAGKIRELVGMMNLGAWLLERATPPQAGVTNGRSSRFAWRVAVNPLSFTATALKISPKSTIAAQPPAKSAGLPPLGTAPDPTAPASSSAAKWIPFRIEAVVESKSGSTYAIDTISIGPPPAE